MNASINNRGTINLTNSAMAVGQNASASTTVSGGPSVSSPEEAQLRAALTELLARLRDVSPELADGDQAVVTQAADEVAEELAAPAPRWSRVRDALHRIGPAVGALVKLAADVATIADSIVPLLPH